MRADIATQNCLHNLYSDHHEWLQSWLIVRIPNIMDAEDLAQDTFLRLVRSPQKVQDLHKPRSFLITVARGLSIDLFRRRSLEQQYLEALSQLPKPEWPSAEENAVVLETLMELDAMLACLGRNVRQVFIYHQFDGLTYHQISELLGVSLRTVKNYMAKAIEHCCLYQLKSENE